MLTSPDRRLFLLLLLLLLPGCGMEKEPPSMVIIMIDTLRADHLSCYGFSREISPNIDGASLEGTTFTQAAAVSPKTGPSVAGILTGRYPDEQGVHGNCDPLPDSASLVSEILREEGYETGAVIANPVAGSAYGFEQGYDHFYPDFSKLEKELSKTCDAPEGGTGIKANRVTDEALSWVSKRSGPFFLYVHYMDPHTPYLPPFAWRDRMLAGRKPVDEDILRDLKFTKLSLTPDEVDRIKAYYEGEIAFMDHEVGRLLDGLPKDTLVVITADHGEGFMEHGMLLHGNSLYQELLHVPLIIKGPGLPGKTMVKDTVSQVDILPTLLDLAGIPKRDALSGRSLKSFLSKKPSRDDARILISTMRFRRGEYNLTAARQGPWKLVRSERTGEAVLYNLFDDPLERSDCSSTNKEIVTVLSKAILYRKNRIIHPKRIKAPEWEKERLEHLRELGYN